MVKQLELKEVEMLLKHKCFMKDLEIGQVPSPTKPEFNVAGQITVVPPFHEKDVERYFTHFERMDFTKK